MPSKCLEENCKKEPCFNYINEKKELTVAYTKKII